MTRREHRGLAVGHMGAFTKEKGQDILIAAARNLGGSIRYENVPAQMLAIARIADLDDLLLPG